MAAVVDSDPELIAAQSGAAAEADIEEAEHIRAFGALHNVVHIEAPTEPRVFQKPRIHQYLKNGKMHRSKEERPVSQFELFLDLVLVGVIHQLAESAVEEETGQSVLRFILTFWGAWTIWSDYRSFVNVSGMDDLPQRVYTFLIMALLMGFASNASGITLDEEEFQEDKTPLRAALGFLLVAKCTRMVIHVFYGVYLRDFFANQMSQAVRIVICGAFQIAAMFAPTLRDAAILFGVSACIELFAPLMIGVVAPRLKSGTRPARDAKLNFNSFAVINIEHQAERLNAFYTITLGESVIGVVFSAHTYPEGAGINKYFGRSVMVLFVAFCWNWLYFNQDYLVRKIHPIRRHWFTAWAFSNLHWPLCAAIILSSAGVSRIVTSDSAPLALRWYWAGGVASALACLIVLDFLPRWDFWNPLRTAIFATRVFFRVIVLIIMATLPRAKSLGNLDFVSIYACLFLFLLVEEMIGKLLIMRNLSSAERAVARSH